MLAKSHFPRADFCIDQPWDDQIFGIGFERPDPANLGEGIEKRTKKGAGLAPRFPKVGPYSSSLCS